MRAQTVTCENHTPGNPPTDRDALIALYCDTDGASWTSRRWTISGDLAPGLTTDNANWPGVTTDSDGRVTQLRLPNNNLNGQILGTLNTLTKLTFLNLSNNQLSGTIPDLSELTSLEQLYLSGNKLSGSIPDLSKLTSLRTLNLEYNELSGSIPDLSKLTSLEQLYLSNNQLSGSIPDLSKLTSLQRLRLNSNQLSGTIPDLSALADLLHLYLHNNRLSGEIPELSTLTSLQQLRLNSNQLSGTIPELRALTNLTRLRLDSNQLSGQIPELSALTSLLYLNLENNELSGQIPDLSALTRLRELNLQHNELSGDISDLSFPTGLLWLLLSNNELSGSIPDLSALADLLHLYLHNNRLSGEIPELSTLASLQRLRLESNQLSGNISDLSFPTRLFWLLLSNNELSGSIPDLSALTRLQYLYLHNNRLSGEIPPTLETLAGASASLEELALWGNGNDEFLGTDDVTTELGKRADRAALRVLYNRNDGENWKNKEGWLDADATNPFSFSDWYGVSVNDDGRVSALNLRSNNLGGNITNALEALDGLETLDLSHNTLLDGILSEGLVNLSEPVTLNIQCTGISTPDSGEFEMWLGGEGIDFTGRSCPPPPRPAPPAPPAPPADLAELEALYWATGGEGWTDDTNWLSDARLSEWYGVSVNDEGRVTGLDLSRNGLVGALPLRLAELSELATLNIEGTEACAPEDMEFQRWLGTIVFQGDVCVVAPPEKPEEPEIEESDDGTCAIAGVGNTPENAVFNLLLIVSILLAISWRNPSGIKPT